nr:MAG TPA: hypothetical protein [Caudoviricetes sp.]
MKILVMYICKTRCTTLQQKLQNYYQVLISAASTW